MGKVRYGAEQIIVKLREIEILCGQGKTIAEASLAGRFPFNTAAE